MPMPSPHPDADLEDGTGLPRRAFRVMLRRLSPADLAVFAAYRSDAELARYQGWQPMSHDAARAFLEEMQVAPAFVAEAWIQLGIADAEGQLLGDLGVCVRADGRAEIGVTLRLEAQGRGLATEAMRLLIELLFERPGVECVVGIADARNGASIRLLERAGLRQTRSVGALFRGQPCTELVFERRRAPIEVRPAVAGDAAALTAFAVQSFEATYGEPARPDRGWLSA